MANITIMGDTIQITSKLSKENVERAETYVPNTLKIFDENGNETFRVSEGNASISKYGICFCSENAEGKLFMSMENPVRDHSDREAEKKKIVKEYAPIMSMLNFVENNVLNAMEEITQMEEELTASVTFIG